MPTISRRALAASLALIAFPAVPATAQQTGATVPFTPVATEDEHAADPFIWLEDAYGEEALAWVRAENAKTLAALASDPRFEELKAESLAIFDATDRIPVVSFTHYGLVNFWQDARNPKGLLRRTTLESYRTDTPEWETILDIDALANAEGKEWVYAGFQCLPPNGTRCLVSLSDGGKDATTIREFDLATMSFVEGGFELAESQGSMKTR